MALKTGLEGKPWYIGAGVGIAVGGVIFALGWWQFLTPMKDQLAAGEQQLADLQTKIQEGQTAKQQLPKFRDEVHQSEVELDKLLRILPARRNTPDLLRRIRSLAEQGDFALKRFTPGNLADKEFFSEWPISINVDGTYHNLALFFDRIGRFSRIINIEELTINALPGGTHTINADFKAKTFVYKEPDAGAPPGGPAAGPKPAPEGGGESPAARAARGANKGGGGPD
ncbi:MAG TPA: type 4a pilus biogenesis protein PilO [Thermoanaerobaculia bacterium]|nr:type 4a pilus biogenesis protein PilO [Thermoanaerobaculia bacterium]